MINSTNGNNPMFEAKQTFSITLPLSLYQQLLTKVGRGKISEFARQTFQEKLNPVDLVSLSANYQALEECEEYQIEAQE